MSLTLIEILATVCFGLAVLHTFAVKRFVHGAHGCPKGSVQGNTLHFLAETGVVFGLWAAALFLGIVALMGQIHDAVVHVESLSFTEPKFVLVVLMVAATRKYSKPLTVSSGKAASGMVYQRV